MKIFMILLISFGCLYASANTAATISCVCSEYKEASDDNFVVKQTAKMITEIGLTEQGKLYLDQFNKSAKAESKTDTFTLGFWQTSHVFPQNQVDSVEKECKTIEEHDPSLFGCRVVVSPSSSWK